MGTRSSPIMTKKVLDWWWESKMGNCFQLYLFLDNIYTPDQPLSMCSHFLRGNLSSFSHNEPNTSRSHPHLTALLITIHNVILKHQDWQTPPWNLHCRAACRCSPNSAGPSWLPSDTADIHKNRRSERRVGGSDDTQRDSHVQGQTQNKQWPPKATKHNRQENKYQCVLYETSRLQWEPVHGCSVLQSSGTQPMHSSLRNSTPPLRPCLPLGTLRKASFLPQQWDLHSSFKSPSVLHPPCRQIRVCTC